MKGYKAHVLAVPVAGQGHLTPMVQLCKRLASKGLRATLALTVSVSTTTRPTLGTLYYDTISDGFDEGGYSQAESVQDYFDRFRKEGEKSLEELIRKQERLGHPVHCVIYDGHMPWVLDVAKKFNILGGVYFTQPCAVDYIYYLVKRGLFAVPVSLSGTDSVPGLPALEFHELPVFIAAPELYPGYFEVSTNQFSNVESADFVLINTFYKLEREVVDAFSKFVPLLTVGPTIPSAYLDNQVENDNDYSLDLFPVDPSINTTNWLTTKPRGSVVYVSFGTIANLKEKQIEELAWGLIQSNFYFLWVLRLSEQEKVPKEVMKKMGEKGVIVSWCPQLEVLASQVVGCFLTHGGWNSITEALTFVVPVVVVPQWSDQTTNAKFVEDVWKVGIRAKVDKELGFVGREEIESCIKEVMDGERSLELKKCAHKWRELAKEALCIGGTSDNNLEELVSKLAKSQT